MVLLHLYIPGYISYCADAAHQVLVDMHMRGVIGRGK